MTTFTVYAKHKYNKRHRNFGTYENASRVDKYATKLTENFASVFVVAKDDTGITNKIIYK